MSSSRRPRLTLARLRLAVARIEYWDRSAISMQLATRATACRVICHDTTKRLDGSTNGD